MLLAVLAGISVCLAGMVWLVPAVLLLALWRLRQEGWLGAPCLRLVLDVQGQLWLDGLPVWCSPDTRVWPWLVWLAGRKQHTPTAERAITREAHKPCPRPLRIITVHFQLGRILLE